MNTLLRIFTYRRISLLAIGIYLVFSMPLLVASVDLSSRSQEDVKQDADRKPVQILEFSGVKAADHVLDLLAGGGYYTELLSRVVGEKGEVVLQIPQAYLGFVGDQLKVRLAENRLKNVSYLLSESAALQLGENRFDSVFLVLGYHDMFFEEEGWRFDADVVMPQVIKSLKPKGKLLIIDHQAAQGRGIEDAQTLHRIEADFAIADIEKRGFRLIKQSNLLRNKIDQHTESVFKPELRRKTDRFVLLFEKL